ncbi:ASST-domain-containing protein [Coniella lustricola]|uniref:ASST-domain-containing protein n=1 Tax=Coniella lustricola TaxID=2025994 RepID=A0A2T3AN69_9PEZI|nr:ASST-domain-containing protein [Coniella lustricola]
MAHNSYWYDWGLYGAYPRVAYNSFASASPWSNILKSDDRCDAGFTLIEPRGESVPSPGPIILDNQGDLVWMETKYGQAMDLKVQTYKGNDYLTFWHGSDSGWFGRGYYLMLDSSYNVFKNITAAGNIDGDLHEFQITPQGTALLTAYVAQATNLSAYGVANGQIYDSIFQEIDLETGELIFEWYASEHFAITDSLAPYEEHKGAWDFFHINSVDKDPLTGNYLVSSRYMCAVACIDGTTGQVLWQLGGKHNSFIDLSEGHATDFSWQHHARIHHQNPDDATKALLTVFDNGAYYNKALRRASHSRGLLIDINTQAMTAQLRHGLVAPQNFLVPSQGSVNILPQTGNVLVGWGHHPAWTEYDAATGEVLCDVHLGASHLTAYSRVKSYRTFKSKWVGRPATNPDAVLKVDEEAVYVSWNGATEVAGWLVQSLWDEDDEDKSHAQNEDAKGELFKTEGEETFRYTSDVVQVPKQGFETTIDLTRLEMASHIQVVAVDAKGNELGCSEIINVETGLYLSGKDLPAVAFFKQRLRTRKNSKYDELPQAEASQMGSADDWDHELAWRWENAKGQKTCLGKCVHNISANSG